MFCRAVTSSDIQPFRMETLLSLACRRGYGSMFISNRDRMGKIFYNTTHTTHAPAGRGWGDQEAVGFLDQVIGVLRCPVQAHHDNSAVNVLEESFVRRVLLQGGTRLSPHITILGSQILNHGTLCARRSHGLDFVELRLQPGHIEKGAIRGQDLQLDK